MVGSTIGPYRIVRLLGEGGMGAVYEAVNEAIERRVAVKVLHANYARQADIVARFFNEARAVNRIDHPGLVQVHEHGTLPDGTAYIVMELLKGDTLSQRIKRAGGRLAVDVAVQTAWQVAAALAAAHNKGIIHRDLKPGNLMLVPDSLVAGGERVKVLDFGIAKLQADAQHAKTSSQVVMGTPTYMSPEQCRGAGAVDGRADVYSLGVILYEMLAGRPPFVAAGAGELIGMHLYQSIPPLDRLVPHLPAEAVSLVHLLLAKDRDQRPTMEDTERRLSRLMARGEGGATPPNAHPPVESQTAAGGANARKFGVVAGLTVALLGVVGGVWRLWPTVTPPVPQVTPSTSGERPAAAQTTVPPDPPKNGDEQHPPVQPTEATLPVARVPAGANTLLKAVDSEVAPGASRPKSEPSTPPKLASTPSVVLPVQQPQGSASAGLQGPPKRAQKAHAKGDSGRENPLVPEPASDHAGEEVLRIAEEYLRDGRYAMAIRAASAPNIAPTQRIRAWRIIGTAACKMKDSRRASEAMSHLDDVNRNMLQQDCTKSETDWTSPSLLSARKAYASGQWARALSDAQVAAKNGFQEGWDIMGKVACRIEDLTKINNAYKQASATGQRDIVSLCASHKLDMSPTGEFVHRQ